MIAVLGGLGAAIAFSTTTLCYARLARELGPFVIVSWVTITGLAVTVPLVVVTGVPPGLDTASVGWLALVGLGNVGGLVLTYRAMRSGKVAMIGPIVSTEGAIAAVFSVLTGEHLAAASAVTLAAIAIGIVLASLGPDTRDRRLRAGAAGVAGLAVLAAVAFGTSLYAAGRVGRDLPIAWTLVPARLLGVVAVAVPLGLASRLRLTRRAAPFAVAAGVFEVLGVASYVVGARHGIAVSAVLASQFGAVAAVAGLLLFGERLTRVQVAGVVVIASGVAALSALQA